MGDIWKTFNENSGGISIVIGMLGGLAGFVAWIRALQNRAAAAEHRAETAERELKSLRDELPSKIAAATRELQLELESVKSDKFMRLQIDLVDKERRRASAAVFFEREAADNERARAALDEWVKLQVARSALNYSQKELQVKARRDRQVELDVDTLPKYRKLEDDLRSPRADLDNIDKGIAILKAEIERCRPRV